eukprot:gb/GECH01001295.1/.p1 GENE.gb/GECH01001295.1/~~gb/GECH01001295.1/.p1  ORF type:complete len:247 (+),score=68.99 gb/GECH01001295.1/:1-741(+)
MFKNNIFILFFIFIVIIPSLFSITYGDLNVHEIPRHKNRVVIPPQFETNVTFEYSFSDGTRQQEKGRFVYDAESQRRKHVQGEITTLWLTQEEVMFIQEEDACEIYMNTHEFQYFVDPDSLIFEKIETNDNDQDLIVWNTKEGEYPRHVYYNYLGSNTPYKLVTQPSSDATPMTIYFDSFEPIQPSRKEFEPSSKCLESISRLKQKAQERLQNQEKNQGAESEENKKETEQNGVRESEEIEIHEEL